MTKKESLFFFLEYMFELNKNNRQCERTCNLYRFITSSKSAYDRIGRTKAGSIDVDFHSSKHVNPPAKYLYVPFSCICEPQEPRVMILSRNAHYKGVNARRLDFILSTAETSIKWQLYHWLIMLFYRWSEHCESALMYM